jgi:FHA domain/Protein of unknown function (DUF4013)
MNCVRCGQIITGSYCTYCANNGASPDLHETGNAVTWPFHQRDWLTSLWMPVSASFLWPFGLLIGLGWSVDAIGRRGRGITPSLPRTRDLATVLKHGFVVMAMVFLYFVIPLAILYKLVEFSWIVEIWHLVVEIWKAITHTNKTPLMASFLGFLLKLLVNSTAPIAYLAIATPLFLIARLRYALTGQVRSFFNLTGNILVCFRHVGEVLLYLFLGVVTRVVLAMILAVVAGTVIGVVIPILLNAANTWVLAYLAGNLAKEMHEKDRIGMPAYRGVSPPPFHPPTPAYHAGNHFPLPPPPVAVPPQPYGVVPPKPATALYCCKGPLKDKSFPVSPGGYFIGRSPSVSQLVVSVKEVSSKHVHVEADQRSGGVWVEDLQSTNGTYYCLGSEPWQRLSGRVRLPHGSRFKLSRDAAEFEIREVGS